MKCIQLNFGSLKLKSATLLLPSSICLYKSRRNVNFTSLFTTSISILQNVRSLVTISNIRTPTTFLFQRPYGLSGLAPHLCTALFAVAQYRMICIFLAQRIIRLSDKLFQRGSDRKHLELSLRTFYAIEQKSMNEVSEQNEEVN